MNTFQKAGIIIAIVGVVILLASIAEIYSIDSSLSSILVHGESLSLKPKEFYNISVLVPSNHVLAMYYNSSLPIQVTGFPTSPTKITNNSWLELAVLSKNETVDVSFYNNNTNNVNLFHSYKVLPAPSPLLTVGILASIPLIIIGIVILVLGFIKSRRKPTT
ncbi:hypothetical protein [Acidianus sp. RZ1]|uniref:hypothetical protein n=1 Tax=Acidianus sp. RZ1 TaxID=1540082 RepID=UPI0014917A1B|nr:hypothetical protein [Acidianus sp. RZ1]NON61130.1 hypothetical protein [Acidianus sp. RZ1]